MILRHALAVFVIGTLSATASDVKGQDQADQLRAIERDRLRSLVAADPATADRLHADDFQLINPRGGTLTKAQYLADIASGALDYLEWEPAQSLGRMGISSRFASSLGALALLVATSSPAADQVRSARQACAILKRGAVVHRLSVHDLSGRYYCDYYDPIFWTKEFFVLGLRYRDRPEEKVGSNLIGWFGIRRSDGELFEWNLEGHPEPLRSPGTW